MEAGAREDRAAISVIVTTFNSAPHLFETLESVRQQTLAPAEILVVDDGSTDASAAIAQRLGAKVLRQANAGPSSARNAGIRAASQPWIAFLDGDDLWKPHKLARQWQAISLAPTARFAFSDWSIFDEKGQLAPSYLRGRRDFQRIGRRALAQGISLCELASLQLALSRDMLIKQSALLIERRTLLEAGLFDEGMRLFEDWEIMLRVVARYTGVVVEEALVAYRRHAQSLTWDDTALILGRERFWNRIANGSAHYPPCAVVSAERGRAARLREAALCAIRSGRVADAETPLRHSLHEDANLATMLLFAAWQTVRHPAGRSLMEFARSAWRRRPLQSKNANG